MSSWPEYDNMSTNRRNSKEYKKRIQKRTKLFEDSQKSIIKLASELQTQDRQKAVMAYKKLRAARNPTSDKDIALYHWDKRIQVN